MEENKNKNKNGILNNEHHDSDHVSLKDEIKVLFNFINNIGFVKKLFNKDTDIKDGVLQNNSEIPSSNNTFRDSVKSFLKVPELMMGDIKANTSFLTKTFDFKGDVKHLLEVPELTSGESETKKSEVKIEESGTKKAEPIIIKKEQEAGEKIVEPVILNNKPGAGETEIKQDNKSQESKTSFDMIKDATSNLLGFENKATLVTPESNTGSGDVSLGGKQDDIFRGIIGDEDKKLKGKKISIGEDKKSEIQLNENVKSPSQFLHLLVDTILPYTLILLISISFGIFAFFKVLMDEENKYLSFLSDTENIGARIVVTTKDLEEKKSKLDSLKVSVDKELVTIPNKIYFKSEEYKGLPNSLKEKLKKYYNASGVIKVKSNNKKELIELKNLFTNEKDLASLKVYFDKEYVLNNILESKIYWKDVYKNLQEATNNTFRYNDILKYITYNNFSVDEQGRISVSGILTDPSGMVFSQIIKLVNTINDSDNFHGASIETFSKTVNPDKNVGGMMAPINLSFYYNAK